MLVTFVAPFLFLGVQCHRKPTVGNKFLATVSLCVMLPPHESLSLPHTI